MNDLSNQKKADEPAMRPVPLTDTDYLKQIAEHLASIRSILKFFTFLVIVTIIWQFFVGITSF